MTAQFSEILIYKGEEIDLCEEPLRLYLETIAKDFRFQAPSTALWRGYRGTWSIEGDRLYLVKLNGYRATPTGTAKVELGDIFPDFPDGVFAHWYTGELRCPTGGLLEYVHGGYGSRYEMDMFLKIDKGQFLSERIVNNGQADPDASQGYQIGALTSFGRK